MTMNTQQLDQNSYNLEKIITHIRHREYMSGIDRNLLRIKATSEVFTPTALAQKILNDLPLEIFTDKTKTFLDNSCGDGQFPAVSTRAPRQVA